VEVKKKKEEIKKSLICVECPRGCGLTVETENGGVFKDTGNFCATGKSYAGAAVIAPKRILTTTIRLTSGDMLPVKTDRAVDKSKLFDIMKRINVISVPPPVGIGRIIAKNIDGDGANLIAAKEIAAKEKRK